MTIKVKKEIIIITVIIILIIIVHVVTQNYTRNNVATINEKISNFQEVARKLDESEQEDEERKKELLKDVKDLRTEWQKINSNMAFYIEHDELEKVNTSLILSEGYLSMSEYGQGVSELENCKYILQHIQDKESLKIINLF